MTVKELIEELSKLPENAKVYVWTRENHATLADIEVLPQIGEDNGGCGDFVCLDPVIA